MSTSPQCLCITIRRGIDFSIRFEFTDTDEAAITNLADYTFLAQIRTADDAATVTFEFDITVNDPETGTITMTCPAADSLTIDVGEYVWDIIYQLDGFTIGPIFYGDCSIINTVSKFS